MEFTLQKAAENIWALEQRNVRAFLLVGEDNALLVDTCFGGDILSLCRSVTDKPITLITTHSDPDHIGCDQQFPVQYLHSAEFERYAQKSGRPVHALALQEGDVFPVGDYRLEVIRIPGHTPGSIALLERKHKFLISGDTVQNGCIFMHGDGRDLPQFRETLFRLEQMRLEGLFDTVFPSHGDIVITADILPELLTLADGILNETLPPAGPAPERFPETVKVFRHGRASMYYYG